MKKRLTRGEKWLFASPLLFLALFYAPKLWHNSKHLAQWRLASTPAMQLPERSSIDDLAFSSDGERLAVMYHSYGVSGVHSFFGRVYHVKSREQINELERPSMLTKLMLANKNRLGSYSGLKWAPDGKTIESNSPTFVVKGTIYNPKNNRDQITTWDAGSGKVKSETPYTPPTTGKGKVTIESNAKLGLITRYDKAKQSFQVVDAKTKRVVWQPKIRTLYGIRWGGDFLGMEDKAYDGVDAALIKNSPSKYPLKNRVLVWDGKKRQSLPLPLVRAGEAVNNFTFHPNGKVLVYSHGKHNGKYDFNPVYDDEMVVWDCQTRTVLWTRKFTQQIYHFKWSSDGKWLAVISDGRRSSTMLSLFDESCQLRYERDLSESAFRFSPDSQQIAYTFGKRDVPNTVFIGVLRLNDQNSDSQQTGEE